MIGTLHLRIELDIESFFKKEVYMYSLAKGICMNDSTLTH